MTPDEREQMIALCKQIQDTTDLKDFTRLCFELQRLLDKANEENLLSTRTGVRNQI